MSPQKDTQEELQSAPMEQNASVPSADVVWVRISPNQVMRAVVVALFLAAVLNPVVEIMRIVVTERLAYRRKRQEANKPAVSSPSQPYT